MQPGLQPVRDKYPVLARDLLRPVLELLVAAREAGGGDVDKLLILLMIGLRTTEHEAFRTLSYEQISRGEVPPLSSLGINMQSIADSSGIPKETVRRKVAALVDEGLVIRQSSDLCFTPEAFRQLSGVREAIIQLAAKSHRLLSAALEA